MFTPLCIVIVVICIYQYTSFSLAQADHGGFTIDLIHRDSPLSPFYNPSRSPSERLQNAVRRSITHISRFKSSALSQNNSIQSSITLNNGEYLMKLAIGTPPVQILAIADTGSDLIWTQCKPCSGCYKQRTPLFDPKRSSTYRNLPCSSKPCEELPVRACNSSLCVYAYQYGDQSYTNGNLATETFTMETTTSQPVALPKMVFGCGHRNNGTFKEGGSGIIGLGKGSLSLITQLGSSIDGKFSYCLVPISAENQTSKMSFGSEATVSGEGVVSTPMLSKNPATFYYLTLKGISVGDKKLEYKHSSSNASKKNEGNIIIDSGTTLTFLPPEFYQQVLSALKDAIDGEPVPDPHGILLLCYENTADIVLPTIAVHFTGADVKLTPLNTFIGWEDDLVCFTMLPYVGPAIFGFLSQMNFLVGYDIKNHKVSFKPTDCTKNQYRQ
ncbi:PREDICTED: aspartic proteinase CDR1-like [Nelumbo nucifera]|nr:PREDICTED: aspartic proteinase CDR1-like [Nelumbo nucifera]